VYKLDIRSKVARPTYFYRIGKGNVTASSGVGADIRFDFETVTIFPDGRVAVSFLDSTTDGTSATTGAAQMRPALAIELRRN
jgi:hypothetical protein